MLTLFCVGFNANFNMMMPFIIMDCKDGTPQDISTCKSDRRDIMIIMLAMQTQAPGTTMHANSIVPLMMMSDKESNNDVILYNQYNREENRRC